MEHLLEHAEDAEEVVHFIGDVFLAELVSSHNLCTKWKQGWEDPISSLEKCASSKFSFIFVTFLLFLLLFYFFSFIVRAISRTHSRADQ